MCTLVRRARSQRSKSKTNGKKYQISFLFMLESIQKHNSVQILMFMCVSICANMCAHTELLSCPTSVAGGAWRTGSWSDRWISYMQWTERSMLQIPNYCQTSFLLTLSPTWWTILHLDYFRDLKTRLCCNNTQQSSKLSCVCIDPVSSLGPSPDIFRTPSP